jgi:hypothetical protein
MRIDTKLGNASSDPSGDDPSVSSDGLTLYFVFATTGRHALMQATRSSPTDAFVVRVFDGGASFSTPFLTADGETLYYSNPSTIHRRHASGSSWGPDEVVTELYLDGNEPAFVDAGIYHFSPAYSPVLSADQETMYLARAVDEPPYNIWVTKKQVDGTFAIPTPVTELAVSQSASPGWLSPDGCRLYLEVSTCKKPDLTDPTCGTVIEVARHGR